MRVALKKSPGARASVAEPVPPGPAGGLGGTPAQCCEEWSRGDSRDGDTTRPIGRLSRPAAICSLPSRTAVQASAGPLLLLPGNAVVGLLGCP